MIFSLYSLDLLDFSEDAIHPNFRIVENKVGFVCPFVLDVDPAMASYD